MAENEDAGKAANEFAEFWEDGTIVSIDYIKAFCGGVAAFKRAVEAGGNTLVQRGSAYEIRKGPTNDN